MLIAFHKPYGVLSQFTSDGAKATLADFIAMPNVYAAGRLDFDSEGLLLLTDEGRLQAAIADPDRKLDKRYLAQVEGVPEPSSLARFEDGLVVGEGAGRFRALPAQAVAIPEPIVAERNPPIRHRANIPTSWVLVTVHEGRNRQVRRMTAAIGHPTLRLIRVGIGRLDLFELDLAPGAWAQVDAKQLWHAR
jgi:23S rRNA pseudouridine2457 synthase